MAWAGILVDRCGAQLDPLELLVLTLIIIPKRALPEQRRRSGDLLLPVLLPVKILVCRPLNVCLAHRIELLSPQLCLSLLQLISFGDCTLHGLELSPLLVYLSLLEVRIALLPLPVAIMQAFAHRKLILHALARDAFHFCLSSFDSATVFKHALRLVPHLR